VNCISLKSFFTVITSIVPLVACAGELPVCSNRTINEVMQRVGCTVGDSRCWLNSGGFCTDYVRIKLNLGHSDREIAWTPVAPVEVKRGDIAVFLSLPHYAYVESIVRDKQGKPVAVNVSEYNFGICLVDEQAMVTDKYKSINTRSGIPFIAVDGGFIRSSR
jgi:hypothetical protein